MVTVNERAVHGVVHTEVRCLSTDEKPTQGIRNGSACVEIDTGRTYLFDLDNGTWHEVQSGGGGSSLSPMSVADVHGITGMGD